MTTKPKTPNKKNVSVSQREAAFKKENLRLQKKIAKLEAQQLSAANKLKIYEPIVRAWNEQESAKARKKREAYAAMRSVPDASTLL